MLATSGDDYAGCRAQAGLSVNEAGTLQDAGSGRATLNSIVNYWGRGVRAATVPGRGWAGLGGVRSARGVWSGRVSGKGTEVISIKP